MIGEIVWDARREVLAVVTGRLGRYWWLRPLGGGREWNAGPDDVRSLPAPGAYAHGAGPASAAPAVRLAEEEALACRLGTTTREDMERHTRLLRERAEALLGTEAEAGAGAEARELVRALLDSAPSREAPAFAAYSHMQALARVLRHHEATAVRREAARCEAAS